MNRSTERRYQVFVSSTFKDLQVERGKVLEAILEAKAFPAGMELFPAGNDEQFEFIKQEIDSSDIYIVIVAGKYGSVDSNGISYTEREYDYAVEQGKYIITFVVDDPDVLLAKDTEIEDVKRKRLSDFRTKVMRPKMARPYKNPDDLRASVFSSLYRAFNIVNTAGWVRGENARRIEDLETINELRSDLESLREENDILRGKLAASDAEPNLDEVLERHIQFHEREAPNSQVPVVDVAFSISWRDLLAICLAKGPARTREEKIVEKIATLVAESGRTQYPDALWPMKVPAYTVKHIDTLVSLVRTKFVSDGLVRLSFAEASNGPVLSRLGYEMRSVTYWELTEAGYRALSLKAQYFL